ncbi:MAG: amidohydrolase family protein, partial [Actinomycetota bacterium]
LDELARLADDVAMATMVLDHMGTPVGLAGPHGGQGETDAARAQILDDWHAGLVAVAEHRNVHCKLSGLLMPICGFGFHERDTTPTVGEVVDALGPHIEFGIQTFGVERCMFASNFPMDKVSVDYEVLWDAFMQIIANAGLDAGEQAALLADNAAAFYRLEQR